MLIFFIGWSLSSPSVGAQDASPLPTGPGVIRGQVENGTPGGAPVTGKEVRLRVFSGFDPAAELVAELDADSRFHFEELPVGDDWFYVVSVTYQDVPYSSDIISLGEGEEAVQRVELTVYEPTQDVGILELARVHWILQRESDRLQMGELYLVTNTSNFIYIGQELPDIPRPVTLSLQLPPEHQNLELEGGQLNQRYFVSGSNVVDTAPIPPGQSARQILLSYHLPLSTAEVVLDRAFTYPVNAINVLLAGTEGQVQAPELVLQGERAVQGETFRIWTGGNWPAGEVLSVRVQGLGSGGLPASLRGGVASPAFVGGVALFSLLAVSALLFFSMRQRRLHPATTAGQVQPLQPHDHPSVAGVSRERLEDRKRKLIAAIARLDEAHDQGKLTSEDYQRRRSAQMSALVRAAAELRQRNGVEQ